MAWASPDRCHKYMKATISRFTSSLMSQLGGWLTEADAASLTKDIRVAMVSAMLDALKGQTTRPPVWNKVIYATSIQTLWYLRTDLMAMLSEHCGETLAREKLVEITEKFRGAMPREQMPKKSRFNK